MSGVRRLILLLALASAPGLLAAQSNVVAPPPPPRPGTVGPEQLRDFSLGGTREQAPAPATTAPTRPAPAVTTPVTRDPAPAEPRRPAPAPDRAASAVREPAPSRPSEAVTVGLPPEPEAAAPTTPAPSLFPPATPAPLPEPTSSFAPPPPPAADEGGSAGAWLPLVALLAALGAAALWWFRRSRAEPAGQELGQLAFAGAPAPSAAPRAEPQAPAPPAPAPAPATKPGSVGIVSSRLRAWLELEIGVRTAAVTDEELQLEVDILLTNSGSAPAREIAVEALVLNAGPEQEAEIARFYARPDADGHAPDVVPPLGQLALSTTLRMPRAAFREYAAGEAKVIVPVVALNAGYKAGSAQGRTAAAFLVGRAASQTDKLGPLPTGEGKGFARLAVRRLAEGVRR